MVLVFKENKMRNLNLEIRKSKLETGFTLIELLIVIGIISLLASLLLPQLGKVKIKAVETAMRARLLSVKTAVDTFYTEYNQYPGDVADLADNSSGNNINVRKISFYALSDLTDDWASTDTVAIWVDSDYDGTADDEIASAIALTPPVTIPSGVPVLIHTGIGGSENDEILSTTD